MLYWPTGATKAAAGGSPYYAICLHQRLPKGFAPSPDLLSGTLQDIGSNQVFEVVSDAKPSARLSTTSTRLGGAVTLYGRNWRYYHTYTDVPGTAVHMDFIYQGRTCQPGTCGGEYPVTISANGSFARRVVIPANWVPGTYLVEVSDAYFGGTGVGDGASPSRKPMYLHIVPSRSTRQARGRLTGRSALGAQTQQTTAKKPVKKGKKPAKGAGKMPTLSLKEFRLRNGAVTSLTRGPDGNLWFTDGNYIGRITPQGKITEFAAPPTPAPFQDQFDPTELMLGPDGNLWYVNTNGNKIGRVTPQGQFSTFTLPDHYYIPGPLIHGAHGSLWFPMQSGGYMGCITAQHTVQLLRWPSKQTQGPANEMVLGPNGKLWYMANQLFIGEILNS